MSKRALAWSNARVTHNAKATRPSVERLSRPQPCLSRDPYSQSRGYAGQATAVKNEDAEAQSNYNGPLGQRAKQKQVDRQFFTDLLTSAATKRDARAYIQRLKTPATKADPKAQVDPQNLFGRSRAVDASPVFKQGNTTQSVSVEDLVEVNVALVKISNLSTIQDDTLQGLAQTLVQLGKLSMSPCVVLDEVVAGDTRTRRAHLRAQADRLVGAIQRVSDTGARRVDDVLSVSENSQVTLAVPNLLFRPMIRSTIPVLVPIAHSADSHRATNITADETLLALVQGMATPSAHLLPSAPRVSLSVDRIIVVDEAGGVPSTKTTGMTHVFVNLEQEYHSLQEELRSSNDPHVSLAHASNLRMLRKALAILPSGASGLITTPAEAANSSRAQSDLQMSSVGTRRRKNPLIHNLLTDKPAHSSSLPSGRLGQTSEPASSSTFVKRGMPLTLLPNPAAQEWTAEKQPWVKLTDPRIDLERLIYLINDSFDRELDVDAYLRRVNDRLAGVIIAGDYEGGAILTWETPPGADPGDMSRLVPYLDKFAVLKKAQGAGGVADILFNAMVHSCFPNGVCWRSRKDNPVNKWYFERSRGTWKIPDMNWTMFWTTPDVMEGGRKWEDYEAVCRAVQPTWADGKKSQD